MDLSAFYRAYRDDGHGRPAYDPAMMVALLLYAYARGNRSSRGIERACQEDVAYKPTAAWPRPTPGGALRRAQLLGQLITTPIAIKLVLAPVDLLGLPARSG
jgi:Transposase domain (DUF772)